MQISSLFGLVKEVLSLGKRFMEVCVLIEGQITWIIVYFFVWAPRVCDSFRSISQRSLSCSPGWEMSGGERRDAEKKVPVSWYNGQRVTNQSTSSHVVLNWTFMPENLPLTFAFDFWNLVLLQLYPFLRADWSILNLSRAGYVWVLILNF